MRIVNADIEISVPPSRAILAFTDAELLKGWWGVERSLIDLKKGGVYTLAWGISEKGIKYISGGIIKDFDPSGLLYIEKYIYLNPERSFLGPQELKIVSLKMTGGCRLALSQGPYSENAGADWDWYYEAVAGAWPRVLITLKTFLEKNLNDDI